MDGLRVPLRAELGHVQYPEALALKVLLCSDKPIINLVVGSYILYQGYLQQGNVVKVSLLDPLQGVVLEQEFGEQVVLVGNRVLRRVRAYVVSQFVRN